MVNSEIKILKENSLRIAFYASESYLGVVDIAEYFKGEITKEIGIYNRE
nr:hypothetical protein [uncultured Helicobacter sp.]